MTTRFRNALLLVGVGAAAFGLGTGISTAQDDGSTDPPPTEQQAPADAPEGSAEHEAYRDCLIDNGAPERPRPGPRRGGEELSDEDKAALDQAWEACQELQPQPSAEQQAAIDEWKTCLSDNGIDLPEIDRTVPPSQRVRPQRPDVDRETMKAAHDACNDLRPEGAGKGFGGRGGPGCHDGEHGPGPQGRTEDAPTAEGSSFQPV